MAIIDSYSETNQNAVTPLGDDASNIPSGIAGGYGVCFTGDGEKVTDSKWYLQKIGSPTGNARAKIWTMTGTFGANGNAGTLLATSDPVDVTTISGSLGLITFPFSGAAQYVTTNGTRYVATVEYQRGGTGGDYLNLGYDSSGTHPGTWVYHAQGTSGVWTSVDAGLDLIFYVDGVTVAVDVTVNLTGVGASPAIGTGTVTIGSAAVTPPDQGLVAGGGRWYGLPEKEKVYLTGVAANPQVGSIVPSNLGEMYRFPKRSSVQMPDGMRSVLARSMKPIPPPLFVYPVQVPGARASVGKVTVKPFYEDIDEELIAILSVL